MPTLLSSIAEQAETILTAFLAWQGALGGKETYATLDAQAVQLLSAPLATWPRLLRYNHPSSPFAQTALREHAQTIVHLLPTIAVPRS
ncbi:MAG: hypothetical protein JO150_00005, partial [Acidobacteriaceae bacterium]|nr:hypothetical protein [Acidobacteriaceae bacterium]